MWKLSLWVVSRFFSLLPIRRIGQGRQNSIAGRTIMDTINTLHLLAELDHEHCHLNHGPDVECQNIPAVDYLVIPVGYKDNAVQDVAVRELVIPVCRECAESLQGTEWTLLYCLECGESRWVCRQFAKNRYRHHVLWLKGCPECSGELGGLYFNDAPSYESLRQCGTRADGVVLIREESSNFVD
jgi:hypothetical protein